MFSLAPTLRALTTGSPITTAIREARRMARRHLETGGAAVSAQDRGESAEFVVPSDIDVAALEAAIATKLRTGGDARSDRSRGMLHLLERRPDGRMVVPPMVLKHLGDGVADRGERLIQQLVERIRSRNVRLSAGTGSAR